ncbi:2-dehydropantoate 2-reductase [Povalibacter uvarum]|uniref:2-dehydropantoate 2-reductase n=1 Tax=Povalibacter uvarum TaxID=732238 RepID=A0A841HLU9_9GAMM|nr:2-dehydropantoate 2-reductase [Povalibacter uvarum]MBB6093723.1 2-dehydropantoate 2-reductase [Povalibacter uvarum]
MTHIALVGPGAIGGTIATWLSQDSSHTVSVAARTAFDGLEVATPQGVIRASPRVFTRSEEAQIAQWVLVATKAYDSAAAAKWFGALCDDRTHIAVLQNGVEHIERFEPYFPRERILPVMIDCPAERSGPGRIRQRGAIHMVVPESAAGADFVDLFRNLPLDVSQSPDFRTAAWRKLCLNSAGAVSAVTLKPAGIVRHQGVAALMRDIIRECIAVACAEGARLDDSVADTIIDNMRKGPADSINSIHADRLAGRPMEVDARNGVIVRLGRKHGISTPMNSLMVSLLESVQ